MKQLRVIVAEDEPIVRKDIIEMLAEGNIITIGECVDGLSAINLTRALKPDLIIMDIKMPGVSGLEAAKTLNQEKVAPVMLLTAYSQQSLIEEARIAGVLAYLVKPVNPQNLIPACHIAVARYEEFGVLHNEIKDLTEAIDARKLIEKAKRLLQEKYRISEDAAFKKIRGISMSQRKSMKEVAEAIILTLSD
jgi:two-component system, response regulator PdtaR